MQLKASLFSAITRLTAAQVPSPRLNAELLLMFALNCDRAYLFAHPEQELTQEETARYEAALVKRSHGLPTQYITGHQEFWGMDLMVSPAVLIPRPETEHMIEAVLELRKSDLKLRTADVQATLASSAVQGLSPDASLRIADVGTGSGAIALGLAKEFPQAEIDAVDISPSALEIARANAARHQLESRIHFREGNLLEGFAPETFDFIVSNPPYVGESEEEQVQLEVRKFEPRNAVFAGPTGTEIIARLIPQAQAALKPAGWLVMEISGTIPEEVKRMLAGWEEVEVKPDLQSIPRTVIAQKPRQK